MFTNVLVFAKRASAITAFALTTLVAAPAMAQTNALTFVSGTNGNSGFNSTRGFAFNVTAPILVTHLSIFDSVHDGMETAHDIGMWDPLGNLISFGTVAAGTANPLLGDFRIVDVPDFILPVGNGYVVGAQYVPTTVDVQRFEWDSATTVPGIEFVEGRIILDVTSLTRPTDTDEQIARGLIGGSFVVGNASAAAPEPGTLAFLALPALGMIARRRK